MRLSGRSKRKRSRIGALGLSCLLFVAAGVAVAGEADQAFFNANRLYEESDYSAAIAEYEKILDMGLESGDLYYNLGNAYFKENRVADAILFYRRALALMPRDGDLEANLRYAELSVKDQFSPGTANVFKRLLDRFASSMTVNESAILSSSILILFWVIAMASLLLWKFRVNLRKVALAVLVIFLLSACLTGYKLYGRAFHKEGVIMKDKVEVRYSPTVDGTVAFNLHKGSTVRIIRRRNGWIQIGIPGGKSGWIEADTIQAVDDGFLDKAAYQFKVMDTTLEQPGSAPEQPPTP